MMNTTNYFIALDCPPGDPRPTDLIQGVIRKTGLPAKEPDTKLFGAMTWDYAEITGIDILWPKIRPLLYKRIKKLYDDGKIRGGAISS